MASRVKNLTSLKSAQIHIAAESRDCTFVAGSSFNLPLILRNTGIEPVAWSSVNPLHVSYRWINEAGETVERDGLRTTLPIPPAPETELLVTLSGRTPEEPGTYQLRASLVLEGVHWACDVDEHGWAELTVQICAQPAWPQELRDSVGGRALRGALTRATLARSLAGPVYVPKIEQEPDVSSEQAVEAAKQEADADRPKLTRSGRLRNWIRRTLGIQNVQRDLERVANAVTRQEQRSSELHQYLERLEIMLSEGLGGLRSDIENLAAPVRKEQIFNHLTALEVNRSLAAIQDELHLQSARLQPLIERRRTIHDRDRDPSKQMEKAEMRDGN